MLLGLKNKAKWYFLLPLIDFEKYGKIDCGNIIRDRFKRPIQDMKFIIESKDRGKAGFSVPAKGLFLTKLFILQIFLK